MRGTRVWTTDNILFTNTALLKYFLLTCVGLKLNNPTGNLNLNVFSNDLIFIL